MTELLLPVERQIDKSKIAGYLLHPVNSRGKAELFYRFGFLQAEWEILRNALLDHARDNPITDVEVTKFGTKCVVTGCLMVPNTRIDLPVIAAVWQQDAGETKVRLITAYPGKETKC